jgi:putative hydrolase of the HAD superfamily
VRYTTIFFDLDDTLYPSSSGLWPTLKNRMNLYMIERMGIPPEQVPFLREKYFRQYGTTLRGLQANHQIDVQDFLAFVHDVKLRDFIQPDPRQQQVLASLASLGIRNVIFTNADLNHAKRVIDVLGIASYFAAVVDVNAMDPYCKPNPESFALAMKIAGETDPARCVMIDDLQHTTLAAKSLGMLALLYGAASGGDAADAAFSDWRLLPSLLNGAHAKPSRQQNP